MIGDPRALSDMLEESQDMQADAVRATMRPLAEVADLGASQIDETDPVENQRFAAEHRRGVNTSLASAGILSAAGGGLLVGMLASPAFASSSPDVQMLQTAASIEVLAVNTYKTALTLPYIGGSAANPVISKFATVTMGQHSQHLAAFNGALKKMGAKTQNQPDPAFVPVVNKAVAGLNGAGAEQGSAGVVSLALELREHRRRNLRQRCPKHEVEDQQGAHGLHHGHRGAARVGPFGSPSLTRCQCTPANHPVPGQRGLTAGSCRQCWISERLLSDHLSRPGKPRSSQVKNRRCELAVTETEILAMTEDLDQIHHDEGVPAL